MNNKLLFKVMTTAALLGACALPASAAVTLTDINGSYAEDAINELVEKGIINGKGDGTFDPTGKIQRQDFAILMSKALQLDIGSAPATATFSDVPATHYAYAAVEAAVQAGIIKGQGDGTFGLGQNLSRQDMALIFVRALGVDAAGKGADLKFTDAMQIASYAKDAVAAAVELGLVHGNTDGTFNPTGGAERQAVAAVASQFLKKAEELKNQASAPSEGGDNNTSGTTEPQTPDTPTVNNPANTSGSGSSSGGKSGSGSSNNGGGTTNPGTDPVNTELAYPTFAFSDSRTIAITYNETLDTRYVPTAEDIRVYGKDGSMSYPLTIKGIAIAEKSVVVTLANKLDLDKSVEVTYSSGRQEQHAIRGISGKRSPAITSETVTYRTDDPAALLDKLIQEAQEILDTAQEGNTTGKYPAFAIQSLALSIQSAEYAKNYPGVTADMLKSAINWLEQALTQFENAQVKPLNASLVPSASFVLNNDREEAVLIGDDNFISETDSYDVRNINNLIQIRRGDEQLSTNIVYTRESENSDFKIIIDDSNVGSIQMGSTDSDIELYKSDGGINLTFPAGRIDEGASLLFNIYENGNPEPVQRLTLPITLDETPPTVTESTYSDGVITLVANELLYSEEMDVELRFVMEDSVTGDSIELSHDENDFDSFFQIGEHEFVITLTDQGIAKISDLGAGRFEIRISGLTDFARNELNSGEVITIPVSVR
ncbi:S-layer homology domain-containing protein [Paenibacillus sp. M1]|uniref:S-layer homology domain-containing protein n=1 Tax=Paenibacillus haidiansis TaxID=1574488 RepID=A0ABU7VSL1_9BACL